MFSFVEERKSSLVKYVRGPEAFTRDRKLGLVHTVGHILELAASRNQTGYETTSQNYFFEWNRFFPGTCSGVSRSSFCEARAKLSWQVFSYLLHEVHAADSRRYRWHGHRVHAVDGSWITLPASAEILASFPRRESPQNGTHYPFGILVTATNVLTGQPLTARFGAWNSQERAQLLSMLDCFHKTDIALLDRGFTGLSLWSEFTKRGQYFVCRLTTRGLAPFKELRAFLKSNKRSEIVTVDRRIKGIGYRLTLRLVRGKKDRKGAPLVIATNLIDRRYSPKSLLKLYLLRWKIETFYYRVKTLLAVEKFHAKTVNGILQELWANLLLLALTARLVLFTALSRRYSPLKAPNFKNAIEVLRRYLPCYLATSRRKCPYVNDILEQIANVVCWRQPGRRNPRISKQPTRAWNIQRPLAKNRPVKPAGGFHRKKR